MCTTCFSQTWIREKAKLIESTDDLGNDLGGIMQLQRRLSGLERDLAAIQAKLDSLNKEADRLQDEKPEEAAAIREKITQITELWQELKTMVSICYRIYDNFRTICSEFRLKVTTVSNVIVLLFCS